MVRLVLPPIPRDAQKEKKLLMKPAAAWSVQLASELQASQMKVIVICLRTLGCASKGTM
jgi:hypothetical protein